jgi:hypothetical protein
MRRHALQGWGCVSTPRFWSALCSFDQSNPSKKYAPKPPPQTPLPTMREPHTCTQERFPPELLNRLDEVLVLRRLEHGDVAQIVDGELRRVGEQLAGIGIAAIQVGSCWVCLLFFGVQFGFLWFGGVGGLD